MFRKPLRILAAGAAVHFLAGGQINFNPATQGIWRSGPVPTIGNCVKWSGPDSITDAGAPCGGGTPPTPCPAGGIDLSLSSGCDLQFYINGVFP